MLKIPSSIIIGDTVTWNDQELRGLDPVTGEMVDYTSDKFGLTWAIRGAVALNLAAVANGSGYRTTITGVQSGTLTAGLYFWQAFVTDINNNRVTLCSGQLQAVSDLAVGTAIYDGRTEARKMLDAVTAAITARLSGGTVIEYQIKGRSLKRDPIPDLIAFRDKLRVEVAREENCGKKGDSRRLFVRFK